MDENQESQESEGSEGRETSVQQNSQSPEVGFPLPSQPSPQKGNKLPLIILGIVILLAAGGIFFLTRGSKESTAPSPTIEGETSSPTETPVSTATPAPVDKTKIKIEIQNGTGISGEAAYLQGVLKTIGYSNIKAGNAISQNQTTTVVTFASSLSGNVVDEITTKLNSIYQEVTTKTSSSLKSDVLIVTGLRKGQTPKPSSTPAPSVSPTPTSSASATPTH